MGVKAAIVPTLVPMLSETKQAATNNPASTSCAGRKESVRFTVASTAPISLAVEAKAPARMNIHIISMILSLAAPRVRTAMRSLTLLPRRMLSA